MVRRIPSKQRNAKVIREADSGATVRLGLLLLCGLVLAGGFLYGCGLHFAALRYGYQTEVLRRERDRLLEERRRFLLEREEISSPVRLERAARRLGMQPLQPEQLDPLRARRTRPNGNETEPRKLNHPAASPAAEKAKSPTARADVKRRPVTPH